MDDLPSPKSTVSPPGFGPNPNANLAPRIRRRNRIITSCLECRRRKLKCDRSHPCNHCVKAHRDCVFLAPSLDANSKNKLNQFKESVDSLEKNLGRQNDELVFADWNVSHYSGSNQPGNDHEPIPEDEQGLEPSPLALADVVYDDDADDVLDDLGVRFGKCRITERIGGFVRPRFSEEVDLWTHAVLTQLSDTVKMNPNLQMSDNVSEAEQDAAAMAYPSTIYDSASWLKPSPEYLAPGAGMLFSGASSADEQTLLNFLPSRDFADRLLERYWLAVHPLVRLVHKPSFEKQYQHFWRDISSGFEPSSTHQALVFAALLSAAVSLKADQALAGFACPREDMISTFRNGCEFALSRANVWKTTRISTLQALVMYLVSLDTTFANETPLCRAEVSRAHAAVVSMAIRLAECAGLHRDGDRFGLGAVETHVRRLIWYQLCFLDVRVCEAVGPRPTIRTDEYDTKLPLNVDDKDLELLMPPKHDAARFTEMTLSRIRYEAVELSRWIWFSRPKAERGEISLTGLLRKVEEFKDRSQKKWIPLLDESNWLHAFTIKYLQIMYTRSHVGIMHRYVVATTHDPPERLLRLIWASGTICLELSIEWDTSPQFSPFAWYLGAYQNWHMALMFVPLIALQKKEEPELDRVWNALDCMFAVYIADIDVFEYPKNLSRPEKLRFAFWIAKTRLDELRGARRHVIPTSLEQRLSSLGRNSDTPERQRNQRTTPPVGTADPSLLKRAHASSFSSISQQSRGKVPSFSQQSAAGSSSGSEAIERSSGGPHHLDGVDWDDFDRMFPSDGNVDSKIVSGLSTISLPTPTWHMPNQEQGSGQWQ